MRAGSFSHLLSAARQGFELGFEHGAHSVEALLWVAETVEESVYRSGSLLGGPDGLRFVLSNPPLRGGAFSALRLRVNGAAVAPDRFRVRTAGMADWRPAATLSKAAPVEIVAGRPVEFGAAVSLPVGAPAEVRLELECPAIPPLVWVEFRDIVRGA